MPKNINSAYRVFQIFARAQSLNSDKNVIDVWAETFRVDEADNQKRTFRVSECLNLVHDEIGIVQRQMEGTGFSENLYVPALRRAASIVSVNVLNNAWKSYKGNITPELQLSLQFCSEILPDEESQIEPDDLVEIKKLNEQLLQALSESKLPEYVRQMLEKNAAKIDEALKSYGVVGAKAFEDVIRTAYGDVVLNEEVFVEKRDANEVSYLASAWRKVQTTLEGVVKVQKGVESGEKLVRAGAKALEYFDKVFPDV